MFGSIQINKVAVAPAVRSSGRCNLVKQVLKRTRVRQIKASESDKQISLEEMKKMQEEMMKDPETAAKIKQMEEQMKDPRVQAQTQQMMSAMQSQEVQQKLAAMRNDPEFAEFFKEIEAGGPQAIFKYWNDPKMLQKLGEKMGDVNPAATAEQTPSPAYGPPPPEINDLHDAAKFGDFEAIEDFIAVGKDINCRDKEGRTPLHYAIAYNHPEVVQLFLDGKADINALDNKNNTPLHYACGYARQVIIAMLLNSKPDLTLKNEANKTPFDLINDEPRNPINQDNILMRQLAVSES